ncbi:MAG: choice-of-anchor D domain-containing protein [Bacteroidota bacterium]
MLSRILAVVFVVLALVPSTSAQDIPAPRVFPNPVLGQNAVTVQAEDARDARVQLLDVRGREVPHGEPLAAGTYFVRLVYANGTVSLPTPITLAASGRRQFQLAGPQVSAGLPGANFASTTGPEITTIPADSLGLGDVEVGMSGQDTVRVRNDGDSDLTVSSAALTAGTVFSLLSGGGGGVVSAGDTLEVIVAFAPTSLGAAADTLTLLSNDADEPSVLVELTGTGTAATMPEIEASTDSLGFGDLTVGLTARDTVTVRNVGTAPLAVSSATLTTGTTFSIESGGGAASIAPGDSAQVALLFSPGSATTFSDTLAIASDDADEPSLKVILTGTGTPPPTPDITVEPDSLGLGDVVVGMTEADTVVVRNDGTADLTVSSITLTSGTVFTIQSGGSGGVIAPGDSVNVVIEFAPVGVGLQADTLSIASDDANDPNLQVGVTGTGLPVPAPEILVAPDSLGLGEVPVGTMVQDTVIVRNDGTADLTLTSLSLATGTVFTIASGGSGGAVAPGDSVVVVVQFAPLVAGTQADTLTIVSDDADEPSVQVEVTGIGTVPDITVTPDSLGLGAVLLGTMVQDTLVVRNDGLADLALSSLELTTGTVFTLLSGGDGGTVLPGDSVEVVIQFAPLALGAQADTLAIASNDPDQPSLQVGVTGTGVAPEITVVPDSLGLGDVLIGTTAQDTVRVRNDGTADLTLSSLALTTGTVFSIVSGGSGGTVSPGDSAQVVIQFAPVGLGAEADTLTIASDDADEPNVQIELTATGLAPDITVAPDSLEFGPVLIDEGAEGTVVIRNEGTSDLTVSSLALTVETEFSILSGSPGVVLPGDSLEVLIEFVPSVSGTLADTLTVLSDDPDEPSIQVELTGLGLAPEITATPDSLGLGAVMIGASVQDTVVVRNDGNSGLTITSLDLASSSTLAFAIESGGGPTVLAPGDSVEVVVSFSPTVEGPQTDTLTIASDDLDEPSLNVPVTGIGIGEPEISVSALSIGYGAMTVGDFPKDTVYVRNEGDGTLAVSSVTLSGANPEAFEIVEGGSGGLVAPGDSLRIVVGFGPIYEGEQLAALNIASDDADEPTISLPLSGTSTSPGYVLMYIIGDSQAAGKGDAQASCDLRPDAGRRGWVYRRAFDEYVPVCDPAVDDLYNGSVLPALVDETYERYGKIPLVVFYTVKGSHLTPEATGSPLYWYMGDGSTAQGDAFANTRVILKRGKERAQESFQSGVEPVAAIHSFGGIDAKQWVQQGNGDPGLTFRPRLAFFDAVLSNSNLIPLYFEIGRSPGRAQFDAPIQTFNDVMTDEIDEARILRYDTHVYDNWVNHGSTFDIADWYADRTGHLGSLGLDYLGEQIAIALDL